MILGTSAMIGGVHFAIANTDVILSGKSLDYVFEYYGAPLAPVVVFFMIAMLRHYAPPGGWEH